jgi:hypothetical protein
MLEAHCYLETGRADHSEDVTLGAATPAGIFKVRQAWRTILPRRFVRKPSLRHLGNLRVAVNTVIRAATAKCSFVRSSSMPSCPLPS